jgi:radical SAM protein with 4Fe4S-binding SPASM domain
MSDFNNILAKRAKEISKEFEPIEGWYPLEVQIEITYDCTLRCAMCYNGVRANEKKFGDYLKKCNFQAMDEQKHEKLNNIVELCLNNGAKFFAITGGEPLLYPDLVIEMIRKIKARGGYVSINSNATLIDEELAKKLKEAGLDSALISIHGANEKTHVKTVCVNNAFERTKNGIEALLKNEIRVVPNFVASHVNISKLKETAEMLYDLGIKHQAYSIFIPTPNVREHEVLKMTVDDNRSYFEQLYKLNSKYPDLRATATLPVPPCLSKGIVKPDILEKFEFRTCPSVRQFMVVNVEGSTSPCIQYAWNETYGSNIKNNSEVISKKLSRWKELFNLPEKCFNCGCKGFCNPCNMNILRENEGILSPLSIPYPDYSNLTDEEAEAFKKKFEIIIKEDDWNKVFRLKDYVMIREEKDGYLTLINPRIQGYTLLKDISKADLEGNFIFRTPEHYRLFKAMNVIEKSLMKHNDNFTLIDMKLAPKYKILTELVGRDFNNQEAVYCTRTDTAGRFFCLPNTTFEQQTYDDARNVYEEQLAHTKKLKLVKS